MDSIVGMELKNDWVASQKMVHVQSMECGWIPWIPYGFHMENSGECKDLHFGIIPMPYYGMIASLWYDSIGMVLFQWYGMV
jgi:hypothetical protein